MIRILSVAALATLLVLRPSGGAAQDPPTLYEIVRPAPHLLVAQVREGVPASAYAAAIAVLGQEGVLVVDTHHGPSAARWMIDQISAETIVPVWWVVNTHAHGDHHWGNSAYRQTFPGVEILAHSVAIDSIREGGIRALELEEERLEERIAGVENALADGQVLPGAEARWQAELERSQAQYVELARVRVTVPDTPVSAPRTIDLGGVTVRVESAGPAHTPGDLVVWVGDETVLVGDLLEVGTLWLAGADVRGWSATLDRIVAASPTRVVAAHGGLMEVAELQLHARVLAEAVRIADSASVPDRDRTLREMAPLIDELIAGGVDREAAESYVVGAVEGATVISREGPQSIR